MKNNVTKLPSGDFRVDKLHVAEDLFSNCCEARSEQNVPLTKDENGIYTGRCGDCKEGATFLPQPMFGYEELLDFAMFLAVFNHAGQKDKAGASYILHILAVTHEVKSYEEKMVAILHDIVEDTEITLEYLAQEFPQNIVEAVDAISKRKNPKEEYNTYLKRVKSSKLAKTVKIADLLHNMDPRRSFGTQEEHKKLMDKYRKALVYLSFDDPPTNEGSVL